MAPKRSLVPLFFLLSFSVILLISLFRPSLPLSSRISGSTSPIFDPLNTRDPDPSSVSRFTFNIKVLTFDRLVSLSRCLRSLAAADYDGDRVNLHIFVDHLRILDDVSVNLDLKLNESHQILDFVDGFSWKFGEKLVHYRTSNAGLQAQWLEAWWPSSDDEFAFVVEDDLEVSPLYYRFLRGLIVNYYYNASNFSPSIYGASLQRPRFVPGKHGNKMHLDNRTSIFLYQLVGTWGQLLFPRPWKEFRLWYDMHKVKGMKPFLEGMVTTGWYKKMGERIWTPWFIKFIHAHGYFNIYTNFLHERALSVSHRDAGVNYGKTAGPDSYLLDGNSLDMNSMELQPLSKLKWYDFCFKEVIPYRVVTNSKELVSVLQSMPKFETIVLVSLYRVSETFIRNLLCRFESQNIQNYLFVGPKSDVLFDLARRGHPVMNADQFFESSISYKLKGFQGSSVPLAKEILVKAYVIMKSLELGYNTWVLDGNILPVSKEPFHITIDPNYDFYVGKTVKVLFIRTSSSTWKFLDDNFIYKVLLLVGLETKKWPVSMDYENIVNIVAMFLEQKGVKTKGIDDIFFDLNTDSSYVNQTLKDGSKKMVFWSSELGVELVQKRLEELGLWIVDADNSCSAVICHPS